MLSYMALSVGITEINYDVYYSVLSFLYMECIHSGMKNSCTVLRYFSKSILFFLLISTVTVWSSSG